jgi:hypothetical protein
MIQFDLLDDRLCIKTFGRGYAAGYVSTPYPSCRFGKRGRNVTDLCSFFLYVAL